MSNKHGGTLLNWDFDPQQARNALKKAGRMDYDALGDDVGGYMVQVIADRFRDQQTVEGKPFVQSQAAKDRKGLTLVDQKHLSDDYGLYNTRRGGKQVELGSNQDYARIHHYGGDTGRGHKTHIEANPVLGINNDDETEIGNIYLDHVVSAVS
jgi:phage virion morphogenesis protein